MKRKLIAAAALTLGYLLAGSAFAQAPAAAPAASADRHAQGAKHRVKKLDINKDGQISKAEAANRPMLSKNFDAIDTNKDGQLSKDELKAAREAHKAKTGK